jgi:dTDP-4-dehydrorhamnose reductase
MLGSHLCKSICEMDGFELVSTSRTATSDVQFDYKIKELSRLLKRYRPDIVINCIAVTSEKSSLRTIFKTNSLLPIHLAVLGFRSKIRVVHIGSNAVFSGASDVNSENSFPIPCSKYGMSKLLGDLAMVYGLVIRTSFVGISKDSRYGRGLLDALIKLPAHSVFTIRENSTWNGITAGALSEFICSVISLDRFPTGIIHLGTVERMNRLQLVETLLTHLGREDISVEILSRETKRNMALDSIRTEMISQIWAGTKYGSNPTLIQLVQEIPLPN